jgi:AbrB family looped-hinge helix DNA binding protein
MRVSVEVGKYGRVILPKRVRDKYGVDEGCKLLITELEGRIVLVPVRVYDHPTEALYGSVKPSEPIEDPKSFGREYMRKKLAGDIC